MNSPPSNLSAEQIALGGMMVSDQAVTDVAGVLDEQDFFRPAHQMIFAAIVRLAGRSDPHEPVAVADELTRTGEIGRVGGAGYLHTLMAMVPTGLNAGFYARLVREHATRRKLDEVGLRLSQLANEADGTPEEILFRAEAELEHLAHNVHADDGAMNIGSFVAADMPFGDPVIPGLLHEQERIIVVAGEGSGKTYLLMQAGVMSAAGLHVFTAEEIPPVRTLIVDLENPSATTQRRSKMLLTQAEKTFGWDESRCWIWSKPGGLDLREAADQRALMSVIEKAQPKLICAGPIYKMSVDRGERGEQLHGSVTSFWDRVRERLGAALWLEHHPPLGTAGRREMRPVGTGLWLRWCEFGLGLTPSLEYQGSLNVGTFRGHREEGRVWPYRLDRGHPWPWTAVYPEGTFR